MTVTDAWFLWWSMLCVATVINVGAWCVSAWLLARPGSPLPADVRARRRQLLWLSAIHVAGCGFRSVFPMVDVPRICLHDTWVSRLVVGRLVATVAELGFTVQIALLLREAGIAAGGGLAASIARALVPGTWRGCRSTSRSRYGRASRSATSRHSGARAGRRAPE